MLMTWLQLHTGVEQTAQTEVLSPREAMIIFLQGMKLSFNFNIKVVTLLKSVIHSH